MGETKYLITGAGTLGREIARLLKEEDVRVLDHSEDALWQCEEVNRNAEYVLGDIRDAETVKHAMRDVTIVINTAAIKHVKYAVSNPNECISTNINGLRNLIREAITNRSMRLAELPSSDPLSAKFKKVIGPVQDLIHISTDKVCYPANIYGESKKMGEMLVTGANRRGFYCCRFGNFLGSQGSVFERWREQNKGCGAIYLTDPSMNRFFIKPQEAAKFVLDSIAYEWGNESAGGSIFIPTMKVFNMGIVAQVCAEKWHCSIKVVGKGDGEKLDEYITTEQEAPRTITTKYGYRIQREGEGGMSVGVSSSFLPKQSKKETEQYLEGFIC